jgi:hypothetical protein
MTQRVYHHPKEKIQQMVNLEMTDYESTCVQIALESYIAKVVEDIGPDEPIHADSCLGTAQRIRAALYQATLGQERAAKLGNVTFKMVHVA